METFFSVLAMLATATLCGGIVRFVRVPLPVLQIIAGIALSWLFGLTVRLDPELFLFLFIAPLLFADGWRIPKRAFSDSRGTILMLAFGLVLFTVFGLGLFIHGAVPTIPIAVAFAVAAALAPTDAVAISAITARTPLPTRMRHILEGEALMNDASGLASMQVAVAAALTGRFVVSHAAFTLVKMAAGGLVIGAAVAFVVTRVQRFTGGHSREHIAPQILLSLLTPFAAYHYAESAHCSGVLAAVAAGMTMPHFELRSGPQVATRLQSGVVFEMLGYALNGIIFVLLGMQLPAIFASMPGAAAELGLHHVWQPIALVLGCFVVLVVLRLLWSWTSLRITLLRSVPGRVQPPRGRLVLAFSVAGVRGAVTLAAMLTLPLASSEGTPFPARALALFVGSGVILLSLLTASVILPMLLRGLELPADTPARAEERHARHVLAEAAIERLEQLARDGAAAPDADAWSEAALRIVDGYRSRKSAIDGSDDATRYARELTSSIRELKLSALRAERDALIGLRTHNHIDDEVYHHLLRELDTGELALTTQKGA